MAKRAKSQKVAGRVPEDGGKVAFQVRFDQDLHESLVKISEVSGLSVNQLMQGICRGAINRAHIGAVVQVMDDVDDWHYETVIEKQCVWFGLQSEEGELALWFRIDARDRGDVHYEGSTS